MGTHTLESKPRMWQFGLFDLLRMVTLIVPIAATLGTVKHSGHGIFRFLVAMPLGILLGVLIVYAAWKLGFGIWSRFENRSEKIKNIVGFALFILQLFWIAVGLVSGGRLGGLIANVATAKR